MLSEGACCGSEAGERRPKRGNTAYSPRAPRGGAFGHRRVNRKPRNRACREKVCNLSPRDKRLHRSLPMPLSAPSSAGDKIKGLDATIEDCSLVRAKGSSGARRPRSTPERRWKRSAGDGTRTRTPSRRAEGDTRLLHGTRGHSQRCFRASSSTAMPRPYQVLFLSAAIAAENLI